MKCPQCLAIGLCSKPLRTSLSRPSTVPPSSKDKSSYSQSEFVWYVVMHVCEPA
jgi:hypothetical protein